MFLMYGFCLLISGAFILFRTTCALSIPLCFSFFVFILSYNGIKNLICVTYFSQSITPLRIPVQRSVSRAGMRRDELSVWCWNFLQLALSKVSVYNACNSTKVFLDLLVFRRFFIQKENGCLTDYITDHKFFLFLKKESSKQ